MNDNKLCNISDQEEDTREEEAFRTILSSLKYVFYSLKVNNKWKTKDIESEIIGMTKRLGAHIRKEAARREKEAKKNERL